MLVSPRTPARQVFHRSCCGPARTGVTDMSLELCARVTRRGPNSLAQCTPLPRASVGSLGLCSSSGLSSPPPPLRPRLRGRGKSANVSLE